MARVAVTGSSGLIGSALVSSLRSGGHEVIRCVRRPAANANELQWDPQAGTIDRDRLAGVDAVVHLAGAGVGDHRWTSSYKKEILQSRALGTATIANAVAQSQSRPALICASAVGFYGDTGTQLVTEEMPKGQGFLCDVVQAWEAAADPAREAGLRVAHIRSGLVMSPSGGAWQRMLPLFKAGLGGRMGSGQQYWSFISLTDEIRAIEFLINHLQASGIFNLTAPNPVTNAEATRVLAAALHRPAKLPAPAAMLKIALGEFSTEVLKSTRVVPQHLQNLGFEWSHPTIESATQSLLSQ